MLSHLTADQILFLLGGLAPITALIGVWAFADMARLIRNARRGEVL